MRNVKPSSLGNKVKATQHDRRRVLLSYLYFHTIKNI